MSNTNDLTAFEKRLLKSLNFANGTNFNYTNLMEWSSDREQVESNLQDGEVLYSALGCWLAIKPNE